jgi:phosphate-selective porin OprO/OprP
MAACACGLLLFCAPAFGEEKTTDVSLAKEVDRYLDQTKPAGGDPNDLRAFWKTGIHLETADGNFKLQLIGRLMWDTHWRSSSDFPPRDSSTPSNNITEDGTFLRRVRLGVQGTVYKNTAFKIEVDFAKSNVELRDVYVGLKNLGSYRISVLGGHIKEPFGLEELTSSKYIFFLERSAPTNAFTPKRQTGLLARSTTLFEKRGYAAIGIFRTVNTVGAAEGDGDYALTLRVAGLVLHDPDDHMILHVGFSFTYRGDDAVRYRARPGTGSGDRLVDTGTLTVDDTSVFDFEIAFLWHGLSASVEFFYTDTDVIGAPQANFTGGYITLGYWITGENQGWKSFAFARTKPKRNLYDGGGGYGGVWIGYRFDTLDLNDGTVAGGDQDAHYLGIIWQWNPNTRLMFNYVYVDVKSGPEGAGVLNVFEMRWQFDF